MPDSLKFNLAIKSATVCADAAIELISRIVGEWTGMMLGWWWYSFVRFPRFPRHGGAS